MNKREKMQALMPIIAELMWDVAAEEEGGRREESGFGGGDDVRYWVDLEDFEKKSLTHQQDTAAIAVIRAGWNPPAKVLTEHSELASMHDGTVIRDVDGKVGEKRDWPLDLAVRYTDGTTATNEDIVLPATVLREGGL